MLDIPFKTGLYNELPKEINFFYDSELTDVINLSSDRPSINKIEAVNVSVEIQSTKLIKTPVMKSYEGYLLSGYKLKIEAMIREKIIYESRTKNRVMHVPYFDNTIRSFFIALPELYNGQRIENIIRKKQFSVMTYLVDAHAIPTNSNSFNRYINIIFYMDFLRWKGMWYPIELILSINSMGILLLKNTTKIGNIF